MEAREHFQGCFANLVLMCVTSKRGSVATRDGVLPKKEKNTARSKRAASRARAAKKGENLPRSYHE